MSLEPTRYAKNKNRLSLVMWRSSILRGVKIAIIAVDLIHLLIGYQPSGFYLDIDNVHNISLSLQDSLISTLSTSIYPSSMNVSKATPRDSLVQSSYLSKFFLTASGFSLSSSQV